MFAAIALGVALGSMQNDSVCWDLAYGAVRKRAASPHPATILYDAVGTITGDGNLVDRIRQEIAYRDDGSALITDDRFDLPYVVRALDPGPPELGPYGDRRSGWILPDEPPSLHVIAKVHAAHKIACKNKGIVHYAGRDAYDLVFGTPSQPRVGLQELWVDVKTADIWKVVLREDDIDYSVEMQQSGRFLVVRHVSWKYQIKANDQWSDFVGEYYYDDFRFPS